LRLWEELLDEFRALGGTAENIRLGQGALGRGVFPIDPAKPVAIRVPENLLIDCNDVVFENGALRLRVDANVGDRERSWLESYQAALSWGDEGAAEVRRIFEAAQALPADLRRALSDRFRCGLWFDDMTDAAVQHQFLTSRGVEYQDREVLMPIVELINHGAGPELGLVNGVTVRGIFPGEVLYRYSDMDSFGFFWSWGFVIERPLAFSLEMDGKVESTTLHIDRSFPPVKPGEKSWMPPLHRDANSVSLDHILIGSVQYPRLPRSIFHKTMRDGGFSAVEEPFDVIRHVNSLHFLGLLKALDGIDAPMARSLRTMAHHQLRAMSFCYGHRDI
jgi:hypothetical protein